MDRQSLNTLLLMQANLAILSKADSNNPSTTSTNPTPVASPAAASNSPRPKTGGLQKVKDAIYPEKAVARENQQAAKKYATQRGQWTQDRMQHNDKTKVLNQAVKNQEAAIKAAENQGLIDKGKSKTRMYTKLGERRAALQQHKENVPNKFPEKPIPKQLTPTQKFGVNVRKKALPMAGKLAAGVGAFTVGAGKAGQSLAGYRGRYI